MDPFCILCSSPNSYATLHSLRTCIRSQQRMILIQAVPPLATRRAFKASHKTLRCLVCSLAWQALSKGLFIYICTTYSQTLGFKWLPFQNQSVHKQNFSFIIEVLRRANANQPIGVLELQIPTCRASFCLLVFLQMFRFRSQV